MILDSFKLSSATFQVTYPVTYLLWDRAGTIAQNLCQIWPDLELSKGEPEKQVLKGKNVVIQTGLKSSVITLSGADSFIKAKVRMMKDSFEVWRNFLELEDVERISTLATYSKEFPSIKDANSALISLNMAKWPETKVFDQPMDSEHNGLELFYRFQDKDSFSTLRIKAESLKYEVMLDPTFVDNPEVSESKNHMLITFDRGLLGTVNSQKFRVDDWIKGFQHILRRDIEKLTKARQ